MDTSANDQDLASTADESQLVSPSEVNKLSRIDVQPLTAMSSRSVIVLLGLVHSVSVSLASRTTTTTTAGQSPSVVGDVVEFCLNESFNVTCDLGQVILVDSAKFGRMRPGKCISGDFNIGCTKDVKPYFDAQCAIRASCDVSIRSLVDFHPCQRDFVSYLEIIYRCIEVSGLTESMCPAEGTLSLSGHNGYLIRSSIHPLGSVLCPWTLKVAQGQRLNLTIIHLSSSSFSSSSSYSTLSPLFHPLFLSAEATPCSRSVVIEDEIAAKRIQVGACATNRRWQRHLLTSTGNAVRVHVTGDVGVDGTEFLLHYSAVGCPDVRLPANAWARMIGDGKDSAMIRCNDTHETWYLTCHDNRWHGDLGNCSQKTVHTESDIASVDSRTFVFNGIILAIAIGILLGSLLGLVLLAVVFVSRRRSMSACTNVAPSVLMTPTKKRFDGPLPLSSSSSSSPPTRRDFKGDFKGVDAANAPRVLMDMETRLELAGNCVCSQPFSSLVLPRNQPCVTAMQPRTLDCAQLPAAKSYLLRNPLGPFCRHQLIRDLGDGDARFATKTVDLLQMNDGGKCQDKSQTMSSYPPGMRSPASMTLLKRKDEAGARSVVFA